MTNRRKPTRAKLRRQNVAREQQLRFRRNPIGWDNLESQRKLAVDFLQMAAPAIILGRDKTFIGSLNETDKATFVGLMKQLTEGMTTAKTDYETLVAKHEGKSGACKDMSEEMDVLVIGEEYIAWMGSFEEKVRPIVHEIINFGRSQTALPVAA